MKRAVSLFLCLVLVSCFAGVTLASGPEVFCAAVIASAHDYSDAQVSLCQDWESAKQVEGCKIIVIYATDIGGNPPSIQDPIQLGHDDPMLILSNVSAHSTRADRGLYLVGTASVELGDAILTGTSHGGEPYAPIESNFAGEADPGAIVGQIIDNAKTRYTFKGTYQIGMLDAYELVVEDGVTVTVSAPPDEGGNHVLRVEHFLSVDGSLVADGRQKLELGAGAQVEGLLLCEEDGEGGYRPFGGGGGGAPESFFYEQDAEFHWEGSDVTGLWVHCAGDGHHEPGPEPGESQPGALAGFEGQNPGEYVVDRDVEITPDSCVFLNQGCIVVQQEVTLTVTTGSRLGLIGTQLDNQGTIVIEADARCEFRGVDLVNDGAIFVKPDDGRNPPEPGRLEMSERDGNPGTFQNNEQLTIEGYVEFRGSELTNAGGLEVKGQGRLEFRGDNGCQGVLRNNGEMTVEGNACFVGEALLSNSENVLVEDGGHMEFRDDNGVMGTLSNEGSVTAFGNLEFVGGRLENGENGEILVESALRFSDGAILDNDGSVTGDGWGSIELNNPPDAQYPLTIRGLGFYDDRGDSEPTNDQDGRFVYLGGKWVRLSDPGPEDDDGDPVGDGTFHTVTLIPSENGSVSVEGSTAGEDEFEILDRETIIFTIEPDPGFKVSEVLVILDDFQDDCSWALRYVGDGTFEFPLEDVRLDLSLKVVFSPVDPDEVRKESIVVLLEDALCEAGLKAAIAGQLGVLGHAFLPEDVNLINYDVDGEEVSEAGYGTFEFQLTILEIQDPANLTGYIVLAPTDIIFRLCDGQGVEEILIFDGSIDPHSPEFVDEFEVPAMHSGTMEIMGYGSLLVAPLSPELEGKLVDGKIPLPFYRAQFHIGSFTTGVNLFGFYVVQADAYCVRVSATSGYAEQKTLQWDLDRYADLTEGSYTSEVFFGNDEFVLSLPQNDIGGAKQMVVETGDFEGYTVRENAGGSYSVKFLSDYYDRIILNVTINETEERELHIHRVGVCIQECRPGREADGEGPSTAILFHGTQYGTLMDFSDGNLYRVCCTYCIPDGGSEAPYGLFVTYTWEDGSKTARIITEPCMTPTPVENVDFQDGVFFYENHANCCDYLLHSGQGVEDAPDQINVIVLKAEPAAAGAFGGVYFGSGAGVTWTRTELGE